MTENPSEANRLLVTGASRGIGAAVAKLFAERRWQVCLTYQSREDLAREVVASIESGGGTAFALRCDLREEGDVLGLFGELDARNWRPTALVNNAGITGPVTRLEELTHAILREVCEVNLIGTLLCSREAVRRMSTRHGGSGGVIVNLSSTATCRGSPGLWIHYAATKGAIDVFTRGLAREVAEEGIRVNAVSPGLILSDPEKEQQIQDRLKTMIQEVPMGRAGTTREVAETVYFLCSEAASYITGSVVPTAGGR